MTGHKNIYGEAADNHVKESGSPFIYNSCINYYLGDVKMYGCDILKAKRTNRCNTVCNTTQW